ncbi:MAG: prepilin-type N-terminal cleavage/methylation domain-containing protein [Candidatus Omnitrophica bacterium]|nr:prepilin-type N-terminal cleavage/methylation domain-containing protein [Candidatus Omnitrophota bacterium]
MRGFTLLETLVTVIIFTFILGSMYGVLNIAKTNYDTNSVMIELQAQARQAMHQLTREIRIYLRYRAKTLRGIVSVLTGPE